jgi:hypothetical protein
MSMQDIPAGPGRYTRRNDLGNVKKIQREGRDISEAGGGPYRERKDLKELSQALPTDNPGATATGNNPFVAGIPNPDAFLPGSGGPITEGAVGGEGAGREALQTPVDAIDQTSVLVRAMFMQNPESVILANMVQAFNEENR